MREGPRVSGPVIDVELSAPNQAATSEKLQAIVDTGASVICMDNRIAKRLGLSAVNRKPMQMADGTEVHATSYMARIRIEDIGFDGLVEVYGVPMSNPSRRVLLGRSFLRNYIVTYHGPEELFYYQRAHLSPTDRYEDHDG